MVFDMMFFRFPCIFATENSSETHEIEILHKSPGILRKITVRFKPFFETHEVPRGLVPSHGARSGSVSPLAPHHLSAVGAAILGARCSARQLRQCQVGSSTKTPGLMGIRMGEWDNDGDNGAIMG